MRTLSKSAESVFRTLVEGLAVGDARKIDNTGGSYMPVCVERLDENRYSVAHYGEQNGDLMADPDVVFYDFAPGVVVPLEITQAYVGIYQEVAIVDANGSMRAAPRKLSELCSFCTLWMRNIKDQQRLAAPRVTSGKGGVSVSL